MGVRFYNATRGLFTSSTPSSEATTPTTPTPVTPSTSSTSTDVGVGSRKSAKWLGVAAAVACVVATAGVCTGLAFVAVAASAAWNARQAYTGRQSWKRAALNTWDSTQPPSHSDRCERGTCVGPGPWPDTRSPSTFVGIA